MCIETFGARLFMPFSTKSPLVVRADKSIMFAKLLPFDHVRIN